MNLTGGFGAFGKFLQGYAYGKMYKEGKQPGTVEAWLSGKPIIRIKALRLLRRWAAG
jgi:hypothetical protein